MTRSWMLPTLAALLVAAPLSAQRRHGEEDEYRTQIDTVVSLARGGSVDLSLISGAIIVTGSSRSNVRIKAYSERGLLELDTSPSRIVLSVHSDHGSMGDTRYDLQVPVGTRVLTRSVSGDIAVRDVKAEVEAHSVSGEIQIAQASNRVTVESVSGGVTASRINGSLRGNAVSGEFTADGVVGEVDVETVSGEIRLSGVRSKFVRAETVSGDIQYSGSADADGRYEFHAHSGDLRLTLPKDAGASFSTETFSGTVDCDCEMTLKPTEGTHDRPRRIQFQIGKGGARITAETFSGDIIIERGPSREQED
jgi:Putative adhesin